MAGSFSDSPIARPAADKPPPASDAAWAYALVLPFAQDRPYEAGYDSSPLCAVRGLRYAPPLLPIRKEQVSLSTQSRSNLIDIRQPDDMAHKYLGQSPVCLLYT